MIEHMNTAATNSRQFRPIDTVRCLHNAFRKDVSEIDATALRMARSGGDIMPLFDRIHFLGEILDYHAKGEEAAVFPAVDKLTPLVAQSYLIDHVELDNMVEGLEAIRRSPESLTTVRATAVLQSQLRIHLDKEDTHLYPILRERTTNEEQTLIGKTMAIKVPQERFPALTQWLFNLIDLNDQVTVTKGWMATMPPQVFAMAKQLIKRNAAANWAMLTQLVPGLVEDLSKNELT